MIGKDILVPAHGVYWPIMLHAIGFADEAIPPLLVHGYINQSGAKMSKSLGNSADPVELVRQYGAAALRYYLMRESVLGQDMEFSVERLVARYNSDLANDLGNLLNRTLNMAQRYRAGAVKKEISAEWQTVLDETAAQYREKMDAHQIHAGLEIAMGLATQCNGLIEFKAPWKLAKDPAKSDELDAVLSALVASLRVLADLIEPVLPEAACAMREQLAAGKPTPLFPRIEFSA